MASRFVTTLRARSRGLLVPAGAVFVAAGVAAAAPAAAQPSAQVPSHCATSVAAGPARVGRFGGIARPVTRHCTSNRLGASTATAQSDPPAPGGTPPLQYYGGPVMSVPSVGGKVVVTPIFWAPPGYTFPPEYQRLIGQYLDDVAAASGAHDNVFATNTEYAGKNGHVRYRVKVANAITDTRPFPDPGCTFNTDPVYADDTGYTYCLDDDQISAEVRHEIAAESLHRDLEHMYVMFTPKSVESCFYSDAEVAKQGIVNECTLNSSGDYPNGTSNYCAYHSYVQSRRNEIYAEMPFPIYKSRWGTCGSDWTLGALETPNGNADADVEISPLSHEMSEAITDPNLNAWVDSSGYENGDECAYVYGRTHGAPGARYNQTINRHHYLTQEEFSNNDFFAHGGIHGNGGCLPGEPTPVLTRLPTAAGTTAGAQHVTILGRHLFGVERVYFGALRAPRVTVVNNHKIIATTPAHRAGGVEVAVTTPGGTSNVAEFTYLRRPVVSKVWKSSGPSTSRRWVTLTGRNFVRGASVRFGQTAAASVRFVSPRKLRVLAPRHKPGTVTVFVADAGGISAARHVARYTYR